MLLLNAITEAARRSAERPNEIWAVWESRNDAEANPFRFRASWLCAASLISDVDTIYLEFQHGRVIRSKPRSF